MLFIGEISFGQRWSPALVCFCGEECLHLFFCPDRTCSLVHVRADQMRASAVLTRDQLLFPAGPEFLNAVAVMGQPTARETSSSCDVAIMAANHKL